MATLWVGEVIHVYLVAPRPRGLWTVLASHVYLVAPRASPQVKPCVFGGAPNAGCPPGLARTGLSGSFFHVHLVALGHVYLVAQGVASLQVRPYKSRSPCM